MKNLSLFLLLICAISVIKCNNNNLENRRIWIIGDSHGTYSFTNQPHIIPWPHHMPNFSDNGIALYEQSLFNYTTNATCTISVPFSIYWLNQRTMHRIGRDGINGFNIKEMGIQDNDVVVFVFGSIDRDNHIIRSEPDITRQMKQRNMDEIVNSLCSDYMQTILANKSQYQNLTVVVASVIPVYIQNFMDSLFLDVFGNLQNVSVLNTQVLISKKINTTLQEACKQHGLYFLDIHTLYETENGDLKRNLSAGDHHIHPEHNTLIKETLIKMLLDA
jgi:hypothetical protein